MTIAELRAWLLANHGISVSHAVMWETLRRLELTLKKRPDTLPNWHVRMSRPVNKSTNLMAGATTEPW